MRLTLVLFRRNRLPNGNIFRGKDRLVKKVEPVHIRNIKYNFAIEEQNMLYLRYPYLTEAESAGHAVALGKPDQKREKLFDRPRKIFREDVTLFERMKHLRVTEGWD